MSENFAIRMYDKQFFRILRQRYEDINSLLLITSRKKIIVATYVKLQQAYYSEASTVGGWTLIGYTAPNGGATTNFYYGIGGIGLTNSSNVTSATVAWQAANPKALKECAAVSGVNGGNTNLSGANWTVEVTPNPTNTDLAFEAEANGAGCQALTPTFANIGK